VANAEDYSSTSSRSDLSSGDGKSKSGFIRSSDLPLSVRINQLGSNRDSSNEELSPQLERAVSCEEDAQRLTSLLGQVDESIRSVKLTLNASQAIEELLVDATPLLEQGRKQSNPLARKALAAAYKEIINQIDGFAGDAEFNGRNYATGDIFEVAFDNDGSNVLRNENFTLTSASLELTTKDIGFEVDAEIIRELMLIENALDTVRMRKTFIEMSLSILENRAKFMQNKANSLQDVSQALIEGGRAHMAIQEVAARRIASEKSTASSPNSIDKIQVKNDNFDSFKEGSGDNAGKIKIRNEQAPNSEEAVDQDEILVPKSGEIQTLINNLESEEYSDLNLLAMELARLLDEDSYLGQWLKFESGQSDIFVSHLAKAYGPEVIEKAKGKYEDEEKFKILADKFMRFYEKKLENEISGVPNPTSHMESYLKTKYGTVYIILARASGAA
jgi:flagellin-like hook-associated protein FlgL